MKNKVLLIGIVVISASCIHITYAQDLDLVPDLPVYTTPSPQATAITRYGDFPVEYSRGLVDISIPLYEIKSRSLSLPMSISFHASGRMANETNGILGMRWVLNCGGIVTRTSMRGRPDERNGTIPLSINPNVQPGYDELYRSCVEYYRGWESTRTPFDSEYDLFRYVLPTGKSGQFILKNENGIKKPMLIPYEPLKIEMVQDNTYYDFYGAVNITDVDGTIYCYGDGTVYSSTYCEFNIDEPENLPGSIPTGWYLRYMISADKQDTIHFAYERGTVAKYDYSEAITVEDRLRDYTVYDAFDPQDSFGPYLIQDYLYEIPIIPERGRYDGMTVPFLSSVKFNHGLLTFKYYTDSRLYDNNFMLNEIELTGTDYRKIKFETDIGPGETDIHYLKKLEIMSKIGAVEKVEEKYSFEYYETASAPGLHFAAEQKDWWGYYSGSSYSSLIPERTISCGRMVGGSQQFVDKVIGAAYGDFREPNLDCKKMGMIKSITYPTLGKTTFDYESNYYSNNTSCSSCHGPGIRIKEIKNIANAGKTAVRKFLYNDIEYGTGSLNEAFELDKYKIQESGMMVHWDYMTGYGLPADEHAGYRVRRFFSDPPGDFGDNTVFYNLVADYKGEEGKFLHKEIYRYTQRFHDIESFIANDNEYTIQYPKFYWNPFRSWEGGKLDSKTSNKKNEQGVYVPAMFESYWYDALIVDEAWDMPTYRHVAFSVDRSELAPNPQTLNEWWYNTEKDYHEDVCSVIGYGFRHYVSGAEKLAKKTTEVYADNGTVSTTQDFIYDPVYHQLKRETRINSNSKTIRIEYDYPFDNTSLGVNQKMLDLNMIAYPLSKSHYSDSKFLQHKRTTYKEWSANLIRPEIEFYKNSDHEEELFTQFVNYDTKGNPLQINFKNNTTAYLWGYNQTYPIAEVTNATHGITEIEIFHENFEGPEGNSVSGDCKTGKKSRTGGYEKTVTGLPNGSYILEYGNKQSGIWQFPRTTVNVTSGSYLISLPGQVDDVRLYPADAQMKTYTYDPLIGMTSITDANGLSTYYEYDDFGRLKLILDNDKNIIKDYTYHYANEND